MCKRPAVNPFPRTPVSMPSRLAVGKPRRLPRPAPRGPPCGGGDRAGSTPAGNFRHLAPRHQPPPELETIRLSSSTGWTVSKLHAGVLAELAQQLAPPPAIRVRRRSRPRLPGRDPRGLKTPCASSRSKAASLFGERAIVSVPGPSGREPGRVRIEPSRPAPWIPLAGHGQL